MDNIASDEESKTDKRLDASDDNETIGTKIQVAPKANIPSHVTSNVENDKAMDESKMEWILLSNGNKQCPFCSSIFDKKNNPMSQEENKDTTDTKLITQ